MYQAAAANNSSWWRFVSFQFFKLGESTACHQTMSGFVLTWAISDALAGKTLLQDVYKIQTFLRRVVLEDRCMQIKYW